MENVIIKFMFLGFWVYDSVYAMDSLLSPKGVNYEGNAFFFVRKKSIVKKGFNFFLFLLVVAALMSVKNKMKDEKEVLSGWDINSVDPCTWNMVGCSAEGFVVSL